MSIESLGDNVSNHGWEEAICELENGFSSKLQNRTDKAFKESLEPRAQNGENLSALPKRVSLFAMNADSSSETKSNLMGECAIKVHHTSFKPGWFGFVVGAVMMATGAVIAPIAPGASAVLIPCGFGFMMNEAINSGNELFSADF
jgi:hypothetical protein